jgi:hypothetical protein
MAPGAATRHPFRRREGVARTMPHPVLAMLVLLPGFALAQNTAPSLSQCAGRVTLEEVVTSERGSNNFDYALRLRNGTAARMTADVEFGNFPGSVTLNNRRLANVVLGGSAALERVSFGHGSERALSNRSVAIPHEAQPGPARPFVHLTNCRRG